MKTILIKFGGSLFTNEHNREKFWQDIKLLKERGVNVVIVHGGGKEISIWIEKLGVEVKFVDGLRYTDFEIMHIVEMVLSGKVNKQLVSELSNFDVDCLGISCRDGNMIVAEKIEELGCVGSPLKIDIKLLKKLLIEGITPIVSPVSNDSSGEHINVNADKVANALAIALKVDFLVFMTDTKGVLKDRGDENSVIDVLTKYDADEYIKDGIICGGMIPKIESANLAITEGVEAVNIVDGREYGVIGSIFIDKQNKGTRIIN